MTSSGWRESAPRGIPCGRPCPAACVRGGGLVARPTSVARPTRASCPRLAGVALPVRLCCEQTLRGARRWRLLSHASVWLGRRGRAAWQAKWGGRWPWHAHEYHVSPAPPRSSRERGRWARGWGHTLTRRPQLGCRCCVSAPHFPRGIVKVTKESCQRLNELIHLKHVEERLPHNNHSINVSNYCNYCHFYPLKTL